MRYALGRTSQHTRVTELSKVFLVDQVADYRLEYTITVGQKHSVYCLYLRKKTLIFNQIKVLTEKKG